LSIICLLDLKEFPKSVGILRRGKKRRNKMTTIKEARSETEAPKKRGRPKGSKNKAETTKTTETHTPGRKKGFRFERDADGNLLKRKQLKRLQQNVAQVVPKRLPPTP
jgi:hypothetical protein